MRFEEAYESWNSGRLTQAEAAQILGLCERSFRRYLSRYEGEGLAGLIDRRLEHTSNRVAPADGRAAATNDWEERRNRSKSLGVFKPYRHRPLDLLRMWHVKIEGWILEQAGIEEPKEDAKPRFHAVVGNN